MARRYCHDAVASINNKTKQHSTVGSCKYHATLNNQHQTHKHNAMDFLSMFRRFQTVRHSTVWQHIHVLKIAAEFYEHQHHHHSSMV
jgi:hypothetical protein